MSYIMLITQREGFLHVGTNKGVAIFAHNQKCLPEITDISTVGQLVMKSKKLQKLAEINDNKITVMQCAALVVQIDKEKSIGYVKAMNLKAYKKFLKSLNPANPHARFIGAFSFAVYGEINNIDMKKHAALIDSIFNK
jgi:dTDP-4-amino-4,6-dideoxygalactose transaminase